MEIKRDVISVTKEQRQTNRDKRVMSMNLIHA